MCHTARERTFLAEGMATDRRQLQDMLQSQIKKVIEYQPMYHQMEKNDCDNQNGKIYSVELGKTVSNKLKEQGAYEIIKRLNATTLIISDV
ncbi:hypothetical protein ACV566_10830 [Staphylococcus aureus]